MDSSTPDAYAPAAPEERIDEDGYPTDEALDYLQNFHGSASEMVDFVRSLMHNGASKVEDFVDDFGREEQRLTLVTGGWSGCESVIGALQGTMFHFLLWESSHRGGKHTFTFSPQQLAMVLHWGSPSSASPATSSEP